MKKISSSSESSKLFSKSSSSLSLSTGINHSAKPLNNSKDISPTKLQSSIHTTKPVNNTKDASLTKQQSSKQESKNVIPTAPQKTSRNIDKKERNHHEKSEIELLKEQNQQIEAQNNQLIDENSILKKQNGQLKKQNQQLIDENSLLKNQNRQLESKSQQLINENNLLKEQNSKQVKGISDEEVARLKSYLAALKEKVKNIDFINFEDYLEESEFGEGATSSVKIVMKKAQEKFAKKEMKEFDHKTFKRFLMEAEILFKLRHPCIIRIYGINYGDDKHRPSIYLSLELNSLENAINAKILTNEQKNRITVEVVLGMYYIHSRNFMHRDLKPLNILLSKNLHVRITDFGLAKEEGLSVSQSKGVGTLRFMAPEIFEENDDDDGIVYTNKVDVY